MTTGNDAAFVASSGSSRKQNSTPGSVPLIAILYIKELCGAEKEVISGGGRFVLCSQVGSRRYVGSSLQLGVCLGRGGGEGGGGEREGGGRGCLNENCHGIGV